MTLDSIRNYCDVLLQLWVIYEVFFFDYDAGAAGFCFVLFSTSSSSFLVAVVALQRRQMILNDELQAIQITQPLRSVRRMIN